MDDLSAWLAQPESDRAVAKQKALLVKERAAGPHHWHALTRTQALAWLLHGLGRTAEAARVAASAHDAAGVDAGGNQVDGFGVQSLASSWWFARAAGEEAAAEALAARVKAKAPRPHDRPEADALWGDALRSRGEAPPHALLSLTKALASLAMLAALGGTDAREPLEGAEALLRARFGLKKKAPAGAATSAPATTQVDWGAKKLSAALRAAATDAGGGLALLLTHAAEAYDTNKLTRRAALDAFVALAVGLHLRGRDADALAVCRRVQGPTTARVSQGAGPRRAAGALEAHMLRAAGDLPAAKEVEDAVGAVSFGYPPGSDDDLRCWSGVADELAASWTSPTLTDAAALAEAALLYAACLANELGAPKEPRARMATLREETLAPALRRALAKGA